MALGMEKLNLSNRNRNNKNARGVKKHEHLNKGMLKNWAAQNKIHGVKTALLPNGDMTVEHKGKKITLSINLLAPKRIAEQVNQAFPNLIKLEII